MRRLSPHRNALASCLLVLVSSVCVAEDNNSLQPFATDGCSLFPDRSPHGRVDWCHCCLVHDLAYWRGGTAEARLGADQRLKGCVLKASGSEALAELMFKGVRAGGSPDLPTSYRWGYGWPYGRSYAPLAPEEDALASSLEQAYVAGNPLLVCPARVPDGR